MTIDLKRLARLAWERRRPLAGLYAVVGASAVAAMLILPRWYSSSATLVPAPRDAIALDFSDPDQRKPGIPLSLLGASNPQDELRMVVRSKAVADSVIDRFDLMRAWKLERHEQAREKLAEHVLVTTPIEGHVVIAVEARSPKVARDMTTAYVHYSKSVAVRLQTSLAVQRRTYLEVRLRELDREVQEAAANVREFEEKHGAISLPDQAGVVLQATAALQAQVAALETELAATRRYFADQSPPVVTLRDRVTALRGQIDQLARKGDPMSLKGSELPALTQQYLKRTLEYQSLAEVTGILRRVYEQARIEEANPVPTFSVLDDPDVPERASRPKRSITVVIAVALSVMFSLGVIQARDMAAAES